jgi:hypothetical protein
MKVASAQSMLLSKALRIQ